MLEFYGQDTPITTIGFDQGREFKTHLREYKSNRGKNLSTARINLYLGFAKALFNFAVKNNYVDKNPFEGFK